MTTMERATVVELIHEIDNLRQIVKLDREKARIRGSRMQVLAAYDEALTRSGITADQGRQLVDQAWADQAHARKASAAGA
jgi:DNA-binding protein H-NS